MWRIFRTDFLADNSGAVMVEFALLALTMILLTFAIIDLSMVFWQEHRIEKAMHLGARIAVVSDPVAVELVDFDCKTAAIEFGTSCSDPAAATMPTIVCDGASQTCTNGFTYSSAAMDTVVVRMQQIYPLIQAQNLVIQYDDTGLGFAGRATPIPSVTITAVNMIANLLIMNSLLGFAPFDMGTFTTTLTGEDLGTVTAFSTDARQNFMASNLTSTGLARV